MVKKEWGLVALAHPNASLDGVGVALKVKGRQSNDDIRHAFNEYNNYFCKPQEVSP